MSLTQKQTKTLKDLLNKATKEQRDTILSEFEIDLFAEKIPSWLYNTYKDAGTVIDKDQINILHEIYTDTAEGYRYVYYDFGDEVFIAGDSIKDLVIDLHKDDRLVVDIEKRNIKVSISCHAKYVLWDTEKDEEVLLSGRVEWDVTHVNNLLIK